MVPGPLGERAHLAPQARRAFAHWVASAAATSAVPRPCRPGAENGKHEPTHAQGEGTRLSLTARRVPSTVPGDPACSRRTTCRGLRHRSTQVAAPSLVLPDGLLRAVTRLVPHRARAGSTSVRTKRVFSRHRLKTGRATPCPHPHPDQQQEQGKGTTTTHAGAEQLPPPHTRADGTAREEP